MTPQKRARLEEDEAPLDLSIGKLPTVENSALDARARPRLEVVVREERKELSNVPRLFSAGWDFAEGLLAIERRLTAAIEAGVHFSPPVQYLYKPIEYALDVHERYTRKYCVTPKKILFLGLNAGPWGMSQTGVPFGEIGMVADWLKLSGRVGRPAREHPARKITGFACGRSEVSGKRFWRLFADLCGAPENFFREAFVRNWCPVALMDAAGRNVTPAELKGTEQRTLGSLCDEALAAVLVLLRVETIVGVGRFSERRARSVVAAAGLAVDVLYIPHPSPRSPSNVNWIENTANKLRELNLLRFFGGGNVSCTFGQEGPTGSQTNGVDAGRRVGRDPRLDGTGSGKGGRFVERR